MNANHLFVSRWRLVLCMVAIADLCAAAPPSPQQRRVHQIFASRNWAELNSIRDLQSLDLTGTGIKEAELYNLQQFPNLESLKLEGTVLNNGLQNVLTDRSLMFIPGTVQRLTLDGQAFSTLGVRYLSRLQKLQEFDGLLTSIGYKGSADFSHLPNLKTLRLGKVTAETIEAFSKLNAIESLEFDGRNANDGLLSALGKLRNLQHLEIENYWTPIAALQYIKQLPEYSGDERLLIEAARTVRELNSINPESERTQRIKRRIALAALQPSDRVLETVRIQHRRNVLNAIRAIDDSSVDTVAMAASIEAAAVSFAEAAYGKDSDDYTRITRWFGGSGAAQEKWKPFRIPDTPVTGSFPAHDILAPAKHRLLKNVYHWHFGGRELLIKAEPFKATTMSPAEYVEHCADLEWQWADSSRLLSSRWVPAHGESAREVSFTYKDYETGQWTCLTRVTYVEGWEATMTWKSKHGVSKIGADEWFSTLTVDH